jgi:hypothetical protein
MRKFVKSQELHTHSDLLRRTWPVSRRALRMRRRSRLSALSLWCSAAEADATRSSHLLPPFPPLGMEAAASRSRLNCWIASAHCGNTGTWTPQRSSSGIHRTAAAVTALVAAAGVGGRPCNARWAAASDGGNGGMAVTSAKQQPTAAAGNGGAVRGSCYGSADVRAQGDGNAAYTTRAWAMAAADDLLCKQAAA